MNKLYFIGGPTRTAKSTIMASLAEAAMIQVIAADAVEHGLRNVLTGEPHQMLGNIELSGTAEWKTSFNKVGDTKPFTVRGGESDLTWQAVLGMIDYYRRNDQSAGFEGAIFTPELVSSIEASGYEIRAAFVGYTDPSHADSIIEYAKNNPHDWINTWLEQDGGDESGIRDWVAKCAAKSQDLKTQAETHGYKFFDISAMLFDEFVQSVRDYLVTN